MKRSRPAKSREELDASREERFYRKEMRRRYRRDLHSNLKQAAQTYTDFSGRKHQATKQIMPMAARRHVEVGTDSTDDEWPHEVSESESEFQPVQARSRSSLYLPIYIGSNNGQ